MNHTLTAGQRHLLRLTLQGAGEDGFASVSPMIYPLLTDIPDELLEREWNNEKNLGKARLTELGNAVLLYT